MTPGIQFLPPEPIKLVDASEAADSDCESNNSQNLRITAVDIRICSEVTDTDIRAPLRQSRFTLWTINIQVKTKDGRRVIQLQKRYSDFVRFRERLLLKLPRRLLGYIPDLPPTVKWYDAWRYNDVNFDKCWLANRRAGLQYFLNQVFLNPVILKNASAVFQKFLGTDIDVQAFGQRLKQHIS
ncbi:HBR269Wp [Eremothecium sinecaudum]|uniref:Endosomal/vacuolar adapter protein YPT35 n=1 Tax=Eremothecium sinecaudum TaxID=45286 RepID=A0A120K1A3_9SACH|nr:HBR269Wp [Eremothecium sinecaudum]AMD19170.1 HBR269Wp [Eremothecium sinecaudum]